MHRKDLWTDENAFPPTIPLLALSSLPTCLPHTERKFTSIKTSLPIFPSVEPRQSQRLLCGVQARVLVSKCEAAMPLHRGTIVGVSEEEMKEGGRVWPTRRNEIGWEGRR